MTRGRKAQPDEIKELRGNPGKRRLLALEAARKNRPPVAPARVPKIEAPDWLGEREVTLFRSVVDEFQQNRIARGTDVNAYARWAAYMAKWIVAKEKLGDSSMFYWVESAHGKRMALHPLAKLMFECEKAIVKLESDLGLNPAARQTIIRGMSTLAPGADLFGQVPQSAADQRDDEDEFVEPEVIESPLGFLQGSSKPN